MKTGKVSISNQTFFTLLAVTSKEQEHGLMFQKPPTPVMSFVYASPRYNKFWMKNCDAKLDIVFCVDNKVADIICGHPHSTKLVGPDYPTNLVIEFPYGTCEKHNIKIGDSVDLQSN